MVFKEVLPDISLRSYIDCYWLIENDTISSPGARERIIPDGFSELVFRFGDPIKIFNASQNGEIQSNALVAGQIRSPVFIEPQGKTGSLGVKFKPNAIIHYLKLPLQEFTDATVALEDVFGRESREITDKLAEAISHQDMFAVMDEYFLQRSFLSR